MQFEVTIDELVHGGQGIGTLADGRKIFVWNALPGEQVSGRVIKQKRSYLEGIAETIVMPSRERLQPREANYLATSPWQILSFEYENTQKTTIVQQLFRQAHVTIPAFSIDAIGPEYAYRNKMEYSFWGDDDGLHLALHRRGSHGKEIVEGSALAMPTLDAGARAVLQELRAMPDLRAGDLKTLIIRASQAGQVVASLFVKPDTFPELSLPSGLQGMRVYHSNPKSPASVPTRLLSEYGSAKLTDTLLGASFTYDVDSFFQVNLPVFEVALADIKQACPADELVDMYAGVGSIGLSVAQRKVRLIELDPATVAMARENAELSPLDVEVIESSTEKVLEYITGEHPVIFDPPRAGLHDKVTSRLLEVLPPKIIYLSCNPATQARDLAHLQDAYKIVTFKAYNFFPHTPHIETLAIMEKKT